MLIINIYMNTYKAIFLSIVGVKASSIDIICVKHQCIILTAESYSVFDIALKSYQYSYK